MTKDTTKDKGYMTTPPEKKWCCDKTKFTT